MEKLLKIREAAEELGLGVTSLRAMVAKGAIGCLRIGPRQGRIRFTPEHLAAYVSACERPATGGLAMPPPPIPAAPIYSGPNLVAERNEARRRWRERREAGRARRPPGDASSGG